MARSFTPSAVASVAAAFLLSSATFAQTPQVDIGLHAVGTSHLEVRVRPNVDMDGIFSAIVFTVRWENSTGGGLGMMKQGGSAAQYMPVQRSGEVHEVGNYNYQVYAGFGFETVASTGENWKAGKEYTIATIPLTGPGNYELVNDSWTGVRTNNADFYASVNGVDRTGIIYKGLANADGMPPFSLSPNPNNGQFQVVVPMTEEDDVSIDITNTMGQLVFQDRTPSAKEGAYRRAVDLSGMASGTYHLRITRNGSTESHSFVIAR